MPQTAVKHIFNHIDAPYQIIILEYHSDFGAEHPQLFPSGPAYFLPVKQYFPIRRIDHPVNTAYQCGFSCPRRPDYHHEIPFLKVDAHIPEGNRILVITLGQMFYMKQYLIHFLILLQYAALPEYHKPPYNPLR